MDETRSTKFSDRTVKTLFILCTLVFASLACNIPFLSRQPTSTPLPPLVWWTDTPNPSVSTPEPEVPVEEEGENQPNLFPNTVTPDPNAINTSPYLYYAQSGDTLPVLAIRFSVLLDEITSPDPIPSTSLIPTGQLLIIPRRLYNTTSSQHSLPDSEFVFSSSASDFDIQAFVNQAGGELSTYREYLGSTGWTSGSEIIARVSLENSINPRLLLALLEFKSGMVYGNARDQDYPMGHKETRYKGLFKQLSWTINQLSIGYYGWREGRLTDIAFLDSVTARLAPDLNAGTVAIYYYFSGQYSSTDWLGAVDPTSGFPSLHESMFGSSWERAAKIEPLLPASIDQPELILPFLVGQVWSFTGGPHGAWERNGSYAALDFAPASTEPGCVYSDHWSVAAAPGLVVRSGNGVLVIDLDGDGNETTGWSIVYLHLLNDKPIPVGTWVTTGDVLGHPSCEGGVATGTHIHLARKYNGEWMAADGVIPFTLDGWVAHAGKKAYEGSLTRGEATIEASVFGVFSSRIIRERNNPQ